MFPAVHSLQLFTTRHSALYILRHTLHTILHSSLLTLRPPHPFHLPFHTHPLLPRRYQTSEVLGRLCPGAEIGERDNTIEAFTDGCERLVREELRARQRSVRARMQNGKRGQELGEGERDGGGGSKEERDRGEEGGEEEGEEEEEQPVASDVVIVTHREAFYGDLMRVLAKTKCPYKPPYVCIMCLCVCCMCVLYVCVYVCVYVCMCVLYVYVCMCVCVYVW